MVGYSEGGKPGFGILGGSEVGFCEFGCTIAEDLFESSLELRQVLENAGKSIVIIFHHFEGWMEEASS